MKRSTRSRTSALERCNCMALRRAARRISRFYDNALAPAGLRATQYSILALLQALEEVSINELAGRLELDRTTTGKNLRPLALAGLIRIAPSIADGRSRTVTLTAKGRAVLRTAVPLWRRAQAAFEAKHGSKVARELRRTLSSVALQT